MADIDKEGLVSYLQGRWAGGDQVIGIPALISSIRNGEFDLPERRQPLSEIRIRSTQSRVRRNAMSTSYEAALAQTPEKSRKMYEAIYGVLLNEGPLTDDEIFRQLHQAEVVNTPNTVRPRRAELRDAGWVRQTGIKRPSAAGSPSMTWEAVPPL